MLRQISEFLVLLLEQSGYLGIFMATVVESFFAPIPSEIVLFTAGYYANSTGGIVVLITMCAVASFGNYVGTLPFYLLSKYGAEKYLPRFLDKWGPYLLISRKDLEKAEKFFERKGSTTVFLARLIPGVRSLIAFPAGLSKMNFIRYTLFTLLGSFVWNLILGSVGFWAFDQKEKFFEILDPISYFIIGIIAVGIVLYCLKVFYNIRRLRAMKG